MLRRVAARRIGFLAACAFGVGVPPTSGIAQEPEDAVIGTWEGTLSVQGTELRIVFHLEASGDGTLTGTMDSPDQGALGIPLSAVTVEGREVTLSVAVAQGEYRGTLSESGDAIAGTWSQGPASLPLEVRRTSGAAEGPARPQMPEPPFPYRTLDVTFPNRGAGIELAGTLTLPEGAGPFPGAVLVSGSGPQDRDETLLGHKPFLVLADHLTREGIAVLRFDDRGVGASGGDFASATSEDFTADALAALSFLRARPEVASDRVGIVGHSEGGLIAPMAANRSADVAFVVMLAGPGVTGIEILEAQGRLINRSMGTPPEIVELNARIQRGLADVVAAEPDPETAEEEMRRVLEREIAGLSPELRAAAGERLGDETIRATIAQFNSPWFRFFLRHDPRPELERVGAPVLSLIGEKDLQVPPGLNGPEIEAALSRGGNPDATVRTLPGLNHLFQEADTGAPAEYARIEETMSPALLEAVTVWILERFSDGARSPA